MVAWRPVVESPASTAVLPVGRGTENQGEGQEPVNFGAKDRQVARRERNCRTQN
jgi:hypothetical protein